MVYVTSDLHGYPLDKFQDLLERAGFTGRDFLFVLGDVIDKGNYGVELLRWMAEQPNVQLILGNHEAMLLAVDFIFDSVTEESLNSLDMEKIELLNLWLSNGATPTLTSLRKLLREEPDILEGLLDYLRDAPLYDTVSINNTEYILVHSGIENFLQTKDLNEYAADELLWARPKIETRYYNAGKKVVFGHTPTEELDPQHQGKAIFTDSWICIDTGAAKGNSPMLLRLDDLRETY